jgi:putative secretion ATPase (PEP-CTERM system associated)
MYERFYQLRERPFALSPDPDYLYPSRVHQEALSYLRYGIEGQAGFVVITGEIGSGKTTLLQTLLRGLDRETTVARLVNTMLDPNELLESILIDFGLDPEPRKPGMLRQLGEFLVTERSAGRLVLLVVDEAQNLTLPALEEVRMLSNLETEKSKLIQIVLVGQPDLREKLGQPELEQLRQRVTVSYHLGPLDAEDTSAYINHRLRRAAVGAPLEFPVDVSAVVHHRSGGVPRLINVICDAVLLFGYGADRRTIDLALAEEALAELEATGVLTPATDASPRVAPVSAGIVPLTPAPAPPRGDSGVSNASQAERAAGVAIDAARDAALRAREAHLQRREEELAEQQRVLAEQARLLRNTRAEAADRYPAGTPGAAPWPPAGPAQHTQAAPAGRAVPVTGPAPRSSQRRLAAAPFTQPALAPRAGFWERMRRAIVGGETAVEERS